MGIFFFILMGLAMLAVLVSLFGGLVTMAGGKDTESRKSNKFMQYRLIFQGLALAFFAAAMMSLG